MADDPAGPAVPSMDWRDRGVISASKSQGDTAACLSFAVAAVIEARHHLQHGAAIDLSPSFIHCCLGNAGPLNPVYAYTALPLIIRSGVAYSPPDVFPYPPEQCATAPRYTGVIDATDIIGPNNAKNILAARGPILAEMLIYDSFTKYSASDGVYSHPPTALPTGHHYICVIGFDDARQCWIVKNSFGPGWGDHGCGLVAYGQCGLLLGPDTNVSTTPGDAGPLVAVEVIVQ